MSDEREQRNQVFTGASSAAQQAAQQGIVSQTAFDKVKADFGLDIPVDLVPLPSNGKAYPTSSPMHGKDSVEIRCMTSREEDILTSKALLKKGTVITELIKSCLIDKNINPTDMLVGDRNTLMVAIRITGYGSDYGAEIECSECQAKTTRTFNLAELPINRLDIEPVGDGMNLFEFKLPNCGLPVRFKFMTGRDEEEMTATAERQKKLNLQSDSNVTTNLLYSIMSVGGSDDRGKIANFVKTMPAGDSKALRAYVRDNEPGIRMKQDTTCGACGHVESVGVPMGVSFFWPS